MCRFFSISIMDYLSTDSVFVCVHVLGFLILLDTNVSRCLQCFGHPACI